MASLDLVALWEAHCRYEFETKIPHSRRLRRSASRRNIDLLVMMRKLEPDEVSCER
jgi:hypothetical protein